MNNWFWIETTGWFFVAGFTLLFLSSFAIEEARANKRRKLWKKIMGIAKKYKEDSNLDDGSKNKLRVEMADIWKKYKNLWERSTWKSISKNKVEEVEKYLISEKII